MISNIVQLMELGTLPFHIGVSETSTNRDFPTELPFAMGIRQDIDLIVQMPNLTVQKHLDLVYRKGFIVGTPMSEEGLGRQYADDFLAFIFRWVDPLAIRKLRILEIGCGRGYLLYRLKALGAEVLGLEPSEKSQTGATDYGIEIVQDVFPSDRAFVTGPYDLILHYGVLEHSIDPIFFLQVQAEMLSKRGVIIFAVPNCHEYILKGDESMFLHEHWSYFTPSSVKKLVEYADLSLLCIENAGFGGSLYVVAANQGRTADEELRSDEIELFVPRSKKRVENATKYFSQSVVMERSVGIFCPARIINLLYLIEVKNVPRFFDDDSRIQGMYYPPFNMAIESRSSLLKNPVNELIIMSRSFGERIKKELIKKRELSQTNIKINDEVF